LAFTGEYEPFSNFHVGHPVRVFGRTWPTSEHAFNAAKFFGTADGYVSAIECAPTPGIAKHLGRARQYPIRHDWDLISPAVMTLIVTRKFEQHDDLRDMMVATDGRALVEGNSHGDRRWGAVWIAGLVQPKLGPDEQVWAHRHDEQMRVTARLIGRNMLGRALMIVRRDLLPTSALG
jgi:ribA/ribD-fused uncharacterized protein